MVIAGLLGRSWAQKEVKWLGLAALVALFRFVDSRSVARRRRAKSVSS
jgi:hypothetical protein